MKTTEELIQTGSIITQLQFLENFNELNEKKETYHYDAMYQPLGVYYGNRFQSPYPCWETEYFADCDSDMDKSIKSQNQTQVFSDGLSLNEKTTAKILSSDSNLALVGVE